jgi:hypothetical protein
MSKELMPQVETIKRNPYLPKEVRAIIYAYLGGPSKVIRFNFHVHSRDPADPRCFKIDNHLTSSHHAIFMFPLLRLESNHGAELAH